MKDANISELKVYDIINSTGFIRLNRIFINSFGLMESIALGEYINNHIFFKKKDEETFNGWFYLRHKDLSKSLMLPEYTISKIKRKLIEMGILRTKRIGMPSKEYLHIEFKEILKRIQ